MKTRKIIIAFGVATLAAITINLINLNAGEVLLTPRQKDNQLKTVAGTNSGPNLATENRNFLGTPRAFDHQLKVVRGTNAGPNLAATRCTASGSPRQAEAQKSSCCKVAPAKCSTARLCCIK